MQVVKPYVNREPTPAEVPNCVYINFIKKEFENSKLKLLEESIGENPCDL